MGSFNERTTFQEIKLGRNRASGLALRDATDETKGKGQNELPKM